MRIFITVLLLIIFSYALALVLQNPTDMPVDLIFTQVPAMRAGLLLLLTLVLGVTIGLLLGILMFKVIQKGWEIKRLRKDIDYLRKQQIQTAQTAEAEAATAAKHEKTVLDVPPENKSPL